jgi:uncharacterized protein YbjT (DUF2867 family)
MKTLIVGATGLLGPEICQRPTAAGHQVRALVRASADPGKRAALQTQGVELVEGDLDNTTSGRLFPFPLTSVRDFIAAQLSPRGQ